MGGRDKLLEDVGGAPMLRRAAEAALASRADETVVVLPPDAPARRAALEGLPVRVVENPEAGEGMAASIRAAVRAAAPEADALILALADMPEIGPAHLDALIAAFDPGEGRAICRAADAEGRPGHPVLFGRCFFEALGKLEGDSGWRGLWAGEPRVQPFRHLARLRPNLQVWDCLTPAPLKGCRAGPEGRHTGACLHPDGSDAYILG
jgi:Uncharacterized MobA-related protein